MSRDAGMGMGGKSGGGSSGNSGNGGGNRESYGAGGQYNGGTKSNGGNGGTPPDRPNILDITGTDLPPAQLDLGNLDPDPYVDDPLSKRDTITSFTDNLLANIKSNPYSALAPLSTLTKTAIQTGIANAMLGNFGSPPGGDDNGGGQGDGELSRQQINQLVSVAPFAISETQAPESIANQYFESLNKQQSDVANWSPGKPAPEGYRIVNMLGDTFLERKAPTIQEMLMLPSPLSSSLQTDYNNAKNNVNSILGVNQQLGYSTQPYGGLMATNLQNNPFNIEYMRTIGLI